MVNANSKIPRGWGPTFFPGGGGPTFSRGGGGPISNSYRNLYSL